MSVHSSLRGGGKGKKHRSVLKRYERLKVLKDKELWSEEKSALGIPKVKMLKVKVKKEKAAEAAPAEGGAAASEKGAAPAAPAKGAAPEAGKGEKK